MGIQHLGDYLVKRRDMWLPKVTESDLANYMMLAYYRNPLNQIFFNEGVVVVALQSFGAEQAWKKGVTADELYHRCVFLSGLLAKEEVQKDTITEKTRGFYDELLALMIKRRVILPLPGSGNIALKIGAETFVLFVSSLIWPMIDSYYATLLFTLSMAIGKDGTGASNYVEAAHIVKRVQWLSEALYEEKVLRLYESCNIESIKNAVATFKEMGVLVQKSVLLMLSDKYRNDETLLTNLIEQVNQYRCRTNIPEALASPFQDNGAVHNSQSLRRSLMVDFPFMAKL